MIRLVLGGNAMFISTHIGLANYFYFHLRYGTQKFEVLENRCFKLNPIAFVYGSIKPDITKMSYLKHHFEDTFHIFLDHVSVAKDESRNRAERSVALGVAIHFLSDYFCKYHAKSPYKTYSLFKHFLYECSLHINIMMHLIINIVKRSHHLMRLEAYDDKSILSDLVASSIEETVTMVFPNKALESKQTSDLIKMLKAYHTKKPSLSLDRDFTLTAINSLLDDVLGLKVLKISDQYQDKERCEDNENGYIYGYFSTPSQWGDQYTKKIG